MYVSGDTHTITKINNGWIMADRLGAASNTTYCATMRDVIKHVNQMYGAIEDELERIQAKSEK